MNFDIIGQIEKIEIMAKGSGIHDLHRLQKMYGVGNWRKMKGIARIRLLNGKPHFHVFPEFKDASYMKRYEIFCRKLVLERHYTASAFITSNRTDGPEGIFSTPSEELSVKNFAQAIIAHVGGFIS